jgi:hypothetical protein
MKLARRSPTGAGSFRKAAPQAASINAGRLGKPEGFGDT